jgi:nucleoside-diphosphate-sugar epimerase
MQQGLLSIYMGYLLKNIPLVVKGSGERSRDIIHVDDVVDAIILSLHNPKTIGKTYNLGTGQSFSISTIIRELLSGLGRDPGNYPVKWESSTPGDPPKTHASIQSIANDTGWQPKVGAKEGIRRMVDGYRTDPRADIEQ